MNSILRTVSLTIGYDKDIVSNINLEAVPGRILTLIGPNGCGKSTFLKTLTGQLAARGGVIYLDGKELGRLKAAEIAKQLSMVMTTVVKPELMTCREVVSTGRYPYTGRLGILSEHDRQVIEDTLTMTETRDIADKLFMSISDGQKQRVMLARAICQEPDILILDEPTSYLDIKYKLDILTRIKKLINDRNIAVIMSLHELDIAMKISDTVAAIGEGRVLKCGSPEDVFKESFIRALYGIENADLSLIGTMPWYTDKHMKEDAAISESSLHIDISSDPHISGTNDPGKGRARAIMIQGTMSNAGKSLIAAGLCRIFADDGYRVAPFKSQNMALNSYITADGGEMGRAQVVQAQCARREPDVSMNPVLLKPNDDRTSQVIVNGKVTGNMSASEYFRYKKELKPVIKEAYEKLAEDNDIIVIEGAGSPVELNLNKDDIVNMGIAEMADATVLLVGDIDRGGVFAQLIGTVDLLKASERERVKGLIVNKFRGDPSLFDDGIRLLKEKSGIDVLGVVPFMDLNIEDEDSLSDKLYVNQSGVLDIAVIRLPHISNYTDFDIFGQLPATSVRYVSRAEELCRSYVDSLSRVQFPDQNRPCAPDNRQIPDQSEGEMKCMADDPDIIIIPGSKNTFSDLKWLMDSGLADAIRSHANKGTVIIGICGGYQMLGRKILTAGRETAGCETAEYETAECEYEERITKNTQSPAGLNLLPIDTVMEEDKVTTRFSGSITGATGVLESITGLAVEGYEIHMGRSVPYDEVCEFTSDGTGYCRGNIYGTYIHGFFDRREILAGILQSVGKARGITVDTGEIIDRAVYREQQYRKLASGLRESLDMNTIYNLL